MKTTPASKQASRRITWPWLIASIGLLVLIGTSMSLSGSSPAAGVWYHLDALIPGERVPVWLHAGRLYRGEVMPDGLVKLFAPDSDSTALVSAALLTEVERYRTEVSRHDR